MPHRPSTIDSLDDGGGAVTVEFSVTLRTVSAAIALYVLHEFIDEYVHALMHHFLWFPKESPP